MIIIQVGVDLRGTNIGMSQQFLNDPKINTGYQ